MEENKLRGLDTAIRRIRKQVFTEIADIAFSGADLREIEKIPYIISPGDVPRYRESIYRERAVSSERVRLAMGLSLRPEDAPVHITSGVEETNIGQLYYEPPLMQVIPSACYACENHVFEVSNQCKGCLAQPCAEVCPTEAIHRVRGFAVIEQDKCIQCGKCKEVCPYDAISEKRRPCADACGVNAIESDHMGRASINQRKCVSCGMCMTSCPFGAISDKSQIYQMIRALLGGRKMIAELAPAFVGQFGENVAPETVKAALIELGFDNVYEVALGADIAAMAEAIHYANDTLSHPEALMLTSCCYSWQLLVKKHFPELKQYISHELTPMVETARIIKQKHSDAAVVFIGPCASKKLEAQREDIRSDIDFVITFEELLGIFEARGIDLEEMQKRIPINDASGAGRGYSVAGGVAGAVEKCIDLMFADVEVCIHHAEGLRECKKLLARAKAGKLNGCLIEGMACPGGCVGGAGTNLAINRAARQVEQFVKDAQFQIPDINLIEM